MRIGETCLQQGKASARLWMSYSSVSALSHCRRNTSNKREYNCNQDQARLEAVLSSKSVSDDGPSSPADGRMRNGVVGLEGLAALDY